MKSLLERTKEPLIGWSLALVLVLAACGGNITPAPGPTPQLTATTSAVVAPAEPSPTIPSTPSAGGGGGGPVILSQVSLDPGTLTIAVAEEQQFKATALDQSGNPIPGLDYSFHADEQAGQVNDDGKFTVATKVGTYASAVTVEVTQGSVTETASVDITIEHGPIDRVVISPEAVELDIGNDQEFTAEVMDAYGNPVPEAQITWEMEENTGRISDEGLLSVGTRAGTFKQGVKVNGVSGDISLQASAQVTVNPDPPAALSIPTIEIAAGATEQLTAFVFDQYGNPLEEAEVTWAVANTNAGSITSSGEFTAAEVAGSFEAAVEARAIEGGLSATALVTIIPGSLNQVVIAPNPVEIGIKMTQQFVAAAADQYGNRISGLDFTWSLEEGGGTINPGGLFTAGTKPGSYNKTIKAEATHEGNTRSAMASVAVEPDRVAFISYRNPTFQDEHNIYVMDADGSNVRQVTYGDGYWPAWSPDGRRIAYHYCYEGFGYEGCWIFITNDDGSWDSLISEENGREAAWSPDGSKIAFRSSRDGNGEIYVMNVDGSNLTRLTDDPASDRRPTWAPDGKKIAFITNRDGNDQIYVMDADGSNQKRLTNSSGSDTSPAWSPDGKQILFQSDRSGRKGPAGQTNRVIYVMNSNGSNVRSLTPTNVVSNCPSWSPDGERILFSSDRDSEFRESENFREGRKGAEVYVMDRNGRNITRLSTNSDADVCPRWAPRKRGVEVSEESIVIPNRSTYPAKTVQEVTREVSAAVVRIETDLGAGSGFIIHPDGIILTNNHVIADAETITIFLEDGSRYSGKVQGRDLLRDLAVVKIEASDLPSLQLGDVGQVALGAEVLVVGYPLGLTGLTVTKGSASGIKHDAGRNITFVQTDATINPGNSGGPLLNMQGQVIGVVTSKVTGEEIEGIGLAVSANTIKQYLERLLEGEIITN